MLAIERKNEILNKLRAEQRVLVSELAVHYGVTEETIRRDLDKLEKEGYATKTYGGAIWGNSTKTDLSYTIRNKTNVEAKTAIASIVSQLIQDGDHLMLDDSSTSLYIAKALKDKKDLTILTYSVEIITELAGVEGWTILSTGGTLKPDVLALVGPHAARTVGSYHVRYAVLSCRGINAQLGLADSSDEVVQVKQAMMAASEQTLLLVDHRKFDREGLVALGEISAADKLITDQPPGADWQKRLEKAGVEIVC